MLYFADYDVNVTFDGQIYIAFPVKFLAINENVQGQIDAIRILAGNVSRVLQAYLETYDLREKQITIRIVWSDLLGDNTAKLDYIYYIDSYQADEQTIELTCTTKMDILIKTLPGGTYLRTHCRYKKFKDINTCGYSGPETDCNRTMQRCKELGNFERFGGFPSLPLRRLYVA